MESLEGVGEGDVGLEEGGEEGCGGCEAGVGCAGVGEEGGLEGGVGEEEVEVRCPRSVD